MSLASDPQCNLGSVQGFDPSLYCYYMHVPEI